VGVNANSHAMVYLSSTWPRRLRGERGEPTCKLHLLVAAPKTTPLIPAYTRWPRRSPLGPASLPSLLSSGALVCSSLGHGVTQARDAAIPPTKTSPAIAALLRALTYPFRIRRAPSFKKDVFFAAVRAACDVITIAHSRYLMPSTSELYGQFCTKTDTPPQTLQIPRPKNSRDGDERKDGAEEGDDAVDAHWIGSPDADVVVLYFHGGGYTQAATEGYLRFWSETLTHFNSSAAHDKGKDPDGDSSNHRSIAVLFLAYSLAPEATYPTQLREASAALAHLVSLGRSPSRIILSGDSAGGNLALSLLSHILHPHPEVEKLELKEPLRGALLISPWVTFRQDNKSFKQNYNTDMISAVMLRRYVGMFLGKSEYGERDPGILEGDEYTEPLRNTIDWWEGLHNVVGDMLVWAGDNEVLVDAIVEFGGVLTQGWWEGGGEEGRLLCVRTRKCAHIEPIVGVMLDGGRKGEAREVLEAWLGARLEGSE